jgi:predicted RNA binding protein YcfA (HicA-like mRNA interferase family)
MCRVLETHGFREVRQRGSHRIMQMRTENTTRSVPVPMHKDLKPGTLASIIRQSGLEKTVFE